jgi:hypothetical protein
MAIDRNSAGGNPSNSPWSGNGLAEISKVASERREQNAISAGAKEFLLSANSLGESFYFSPITSH